MRQHITLTTDFGTQDWFVGTMKGVIAGIAPKAVVIDLTHEVPPGDIRPGRLPTINNETRARIDLTGVNANVVFASEDAAINNFDGAHFSLNGVNANVVVAETGTAEINNYNGAHFQPERPQRRSSFR